MGGSRDTQEAKAGAGMAGFGPRERTEFYYTMAVLAEIGMSNYHAYLRMEKAYAKRKDAASQHVVAILRALAERNGKYDIPTVMGEFGVELTVVEDCILSTVEEGSKAAKQLRALAEVMVRLNALDSGMKAT